MNHREGISEKSGLRKTARTIANSKFFADASALYIGRTLNLGIGLLSFLVSGLTFSTRQIATISLFEMVGGLLLLCGFTWSVVGVTRYGKQEHVDSERINYTSTIRLGIIGPILLASIALVFWGRGQLTRYIATEDDSLILFLVLNLLFMVAHEHLGALVTTAEKHAANALFYLAQGTGRLAILIALWWGLFAVSAETYLKAIVALEAILLVPRILFIDLGFLWPLRWVAGSDVRRFLGYVGPQVLGFTALYVINWVDIYFIRQYWSLDALGAYQFLYSLFIKMASFGLLLNTVVFPRILVWKQSNRQRIDQYLQSVPPKLLLVTVAGVGLFMGVMEPVLSFFFDDKYVSAYPAFRLIVCAVPFYFMSYVYIPVLNSFDRVALVQAANVLSALTNLLVDFLLIRHFGLIAAGLGTFIAYGVKYALVLAGVQQMFRPKAGWTLAGSAFFMLIVSLYALTLIQEAT